jgi:hypothetical protein
MVEQDFESKVLSMLDEIDTKVEKNNALLRALAHASGTTEVDLRTAAVELGISDHALDPGHNEVDPE